MELKSLISEYFTSGCIVLVSICLVVACIGHDDSKVKGLWDTAVALPTTMLIALGLVGTVIATSLGASNNAVSMFLFSRMEGGIRRQILERFLADRGYSSLPILRGVERDEEGRIPGRTAKEVFSSIRAYLYGYSSEVGQRLDFHRNDIRFCRGLVVPHVILCVTAPYASYVFTRNPYLLILSLAVMVISSWGIVAAYESRLRWMQEYSLRTYLHVCPSEEPPEMSRLSFVLVGSTGAGKTKLARALTERCRNLRALPKCTTRMPRKDERHCIDYRFLADADFDRLANEGRFVARRRSEFDDTLYAVLKEDLDGEEDLVFTNHSVKGLGVLREALNRCGFKKVVAIHVMVGPDVAGRRLPRGDFLRADRLRVEESLARELSMADNRVIQYDVENYDSNLAALDVIWEIIKYERNLSAIGHCRDCNVDTVLAHRRP